MLEAALMALDIAPGLGRHFAFEKFRNFDWRRWRELSHQSACRQKAKTPQAIYGSDLSGDVLKAARTNLAAAGLEKIVSLKQANVLEISAPAKEGIQKGESIPSSSPSPAAAPALKAQPGRQAKQAHQAPRAPLGHKAQASP